MCAWLTERVSGVGVRGGKRGPWPSPVTGDCGAQGLGTSCDPASLSRIPWIGERERDYLRRAPYRGWKTWSLSSPAEKLRLRDPWRTGPSRCPCRDGKGNTSFQTLVLQLHLCPCASGSLSTSQGVGLGIESGMGPLRNTSPSAHILPSPHSPWGFVRPRSPKEESPAGDCISSPRTRSALAPGPPSSVPSLWPCFSGLRDPPPLPNPRSHPHSVCACRPLQPLLPLTWLWDPVPAQTLLPAPLGAPDPVRGRHVEPLASGPPHARL